MKKWIGSIAFAAAAFGALAPVQAADYRWLSGWDDNYPATPYIVTPFVKAIEAASKGSIKIQRCHNSLPSTNRGSSIGFGQCPHSPSTQYGPRSG